MIQQRILEIVAATPNCNEALIVDKLCIDYEEVRPMLASLAAVGDIEERGTAGPSGSLGKVFVLSDRFKASDSYKSIAMKVDAASFATPGMNRIERAIAFVRDRGSVTSAELHALMGLAADEYASNALASAVRTKRLIKDGKNWTLGTGPDGYAARVTTKGDEPELARTLAPLARAPFPGPKPMPEAERESADVLAVEESANEEVCAQAAADVMASMVAASHASSARCVPRAVAPAIAPTADAAGEKPAVPGKTLEAASTTFADPPAHSSSIACGIFSDGTVEIRRDGRTTAVLSSDEAEHLADFWNRVSTNVREAS